MTRNQRFSLFSMGRPMAPTLPTPSGGINTAGKREQLIFRYPRDAAPAVRMLPTPQRRRTR